MLRRRAVLSLLLLPFGCDAPPVQPDPRSLFLSEFAVRRLADGLPLKDVEEVEAGAGVLVSISWIPAAAPPREIGGHPVQEVREWGTIVHLYPSGGRDQPGAREVRWGRYVNPKEPPFSHGHFKGIGRIRTVVGDTNAPKPTSKDWKPGEVRSWAELATRESESGDWSYEVVLYPAFRDISDIRYEAGPPIVLHKGTIRIAKQGGMKLEDEA